MCWPRKCLPKPELSSKALCLLYPVLFSGTMPVNQQLLLMFMALRICEWLWWGDTFVCQMLRVLIFMDILCTKDEPLLSLHR